MLLVVRSSGLTDPSVDRIHRHADGVKNRISHPRPHKTTFLYKITSAPGKYATLSGKGDLLVAPKAQAAEFTVTEAPRRQRELERRGFKTKLEVV